MRRVSYLQQVGFIRQDAEETLLRIMCERNVGLRSLLYELATETMTIAEISDQQLDTHPDLGWGRGETDMALQRVNWLWSLGCVEKQGDVYQLTDAGVEFVDEAVGAWADATWTPDAVSEEMTADVYETTIQSGAVDPEFRVTVLSRHGQRCPVSGVDHPGLLDVAHVLPWSDYPDHRADLGNVLPLNKTHHAAFDRDLFTIDGEYRLRVNLPSRRKATCYNGLLSNRKGNASPWLTRLLIRRTTNGITRRSSGYRTLF